MQDTVPIDRAFCKPLEGEDTGDKQGTSTSGIDVSTNKAKSLPFPEWKGSKIINLKPGAWMVSLGMVPY